jgi:hypothetical protein
MEKPEEDYEMAEIQCACGWYGSADSVDQVRPLGENITLFLCPKCGEKLWEDKTEAS